jgi:pimeloyl-ACP methyl ester carboxylesterase
MIDGSKNFPKKKFDCLEHRFDYERLRKRMATTPLLVLAGTEDLLVPYDALMKDMKGYGKSSLHHFEPIEGGAHNDALGTDAADFAFEKMNELVALKSEGCAGKFDSL